MMENVTGRNKYIFIFAVVLLFVGGSLFLWSNAKEASSIHDEPSVMASTKAVVEQTVPEGMKWWVHPSFQFSLLVPDAVQTEVRYEQGGAETDVFTSAKDEKEFQLFILPYHESVISSSRIQEDTYRTATETPQEIVIGSGIHALAFTSSDPLLGELREVWFLMNGHLIEATTPIENDQWLAKILNSFKAD